MKQNNRIGVIDGFRAIAILSVILFHYYTHWTYPYENFNLYPYTNKYSYFQYGYLGVEFFFIISGFVIAFTLYRTDSIKHFWQKRIARLVPPMVIFSVITLVFLVAVDTANIFPNGHSVTNLFYSITFISPVVINACLKFTGLHFNYLTGAYWSLWPEIQFYCLASIIYYCNPLKFINRFAISSLLLFMANWFINNIKSTNLLHIHLNGAFVDGCNFWIEGIFNISTYILWFLIGVLFFDMYTKKATKATVIYIVTAILFQLYNCFHWEIRLIVVLILILFILLIYWPATVNFISYKPFAAIGMASYSLYLVHNDIALVLIHKYAAYWGRFDFLFPLMLLFIFIIISVASYRFIERPIMRFINKKI